MVTRTRDGQKGISYESKNVVEDEANSKCCEFLIEIRFGGWTDARSVFFQLHEVGQPEESCAIRSVRSVLTTEVRKIAPKFNRCP